jgi:hypothetical protein
VSVLINLLIVTTVFANKTRSLITLIDISVEDPQAPYVKSGRPVMKKCACLSCLENVQQYNLDPFCDTCNYSNIATSCDSLPDASFPIGLTSFACLAQDLCRADGTLRARLLRHSCCQGWGLGVVLTA